MPLPMPPFQPSSLLTASASAGPACATDPRDPTSPGAGPLSPEQREWAEGLHLSHPALFLAPWGSKLPSQTLSTLGFRDSAQAEKSGHVCIKPARRTGARSWPGHWLHPRDFVTLQGVVADFEQSVAETRAKRQKAKELQLGRERAEREAVTARCVHATALTLSQIAQVGLAQVQAVLTPEVMQRANLVAPESTGPAALRLEAVARLLAAFAPKWRGQLPAHQEPDARKRKARSDEPGLEVDKGTRAQDDAKSLTSPQFGYEVEGRCVPLALTPSATARCAAVVQALVAQAGGSATSHPVRLEPGHLPAYGEMLEADLLQAQQLGSALAEHWARTCPAWMPLADLQAWAQRTAARHLQAPTLGAPDVSAVTAHPAERHSAANGLSEQGVVLEVQATKTTPYFALTVELKREDLARLAWKQFSEGPKQPGQPEPARRRLRSLDLARVAAPMARARWDAAVQEVCHVHPYNALAQGLGLDESQWTDILAICLAKSIRAQIGEALPMPWHAEGRDDNPQHVWSMLGRLPLGPLAQRVLNDTSLELQDALLQQRRSRAADLCEKEVPAHVPDHFPLARSLGRRLTIIHGPTNSGKTHRALQLLRKSSSGVYLGPLRLLALEVFERLNDTEEGAALPTSLLTGELVRTVPGAQHTAATIEMLDLHKALDVAVIDEVQMLADPQRGWAWLQAVLGAPARHVVMLGSSSALPLVRQLAARTGELLEEIEVHRLSPLRVLPRTTPLAQVQPGTALVVFSRQAALGLADQMRRVHGRRVSVIYGALSPEVRAEQARQFRQSETDILVATDAIAMGLNLPVSTVIFTTAVKWDGKQERSLDSALTLQIAGRAGRFGLRGCGQVGALDGHTLQHVRKCLANPPPAVKGPLQVALSAHIAQVIARHLETDNLSLVMAFFREHIRLESWARPLCTPEQVTLAHTLDDLPLSLADKLALSNAPAVDKSVVHFAFRSMALAVATRPGAAGVQAGQHPDKPPLQPHEKYVAAVEGLLQAAPTRLALAQMEDCLRSLSLYLWVSYRWPEVFRHADQALALQAQLNEAVTLALTQASGKACASCGAALAWNSRFGRCEPCFRRRDDGWY